MNHMCIAAKLLMSVMLLGLLGVAFVQESELPPGPEAVHRAEFAPDEVPEDFDVVSLILDFAPGAETPLHSHPGPGIVLVLEGELTGFDEEGNEVLYREGDTFLEGPGNQHRVRNDTDQTVQVLFTILLPEGEPLTTLAE